MDAPGGGNVTFTDEELTETLRLLKAHLIASYKQFERMERLMKQQRIRNAAMPEQLHKR
jgi:hypothetical protein